MRAILYLNNEKVKEAQYPREDMQPILDLEAGYEWQLIVENEVPEFDYMKSSVRRSEIKTNNPNAEFKHLNNTVINYDVVDLPLDEIKQNLINKTANDRQELIREKIETQIVSAAQTGTDTEVLTNKALFPMWKFPFAYPIGFNCQDFNNENELVLYRVVQAHTSQEDWKPKDVPALFTRVALPNQVLAWKQPVGSSDAYARGAVVTHKGQIWENTGSDANVWEPSVFGWTVKN
jgi:hypothetical protein